MERRQLGVSPATQLASLAAASLATASAAVAAAAVAASRTTAAVAALAPAAARPAGGNLNRPACSCTCAERKSRSHGSRLYQTLTWLILQLLDAPQGFFSSLVSDTVATPLYQLDLTRLLR